MDRLNAMKVFLAVVEAGGFSAAARRLDMSVPSVTRLVAELETHLGTRLLQRTTRRVNLTPAGQQYAEQAHMILLAVDNAFAMVQDSTEAPSGTLRVVTAPVFAEFLIAPLLGAFREAYPRITLDVHVDANPNPELGPYDIGFLSAREGLDSNIIARTLFTSDGILCASPAYLERHGTPANPADLAQHQCLLRRSTALRTGVVHLWKAGQSVQSPPEVVMTVQPTASINHTGSLLRMALDGAGIAAFSTDLTATYLASGQLQHVLPQWITGRFSLLAALPSRQHLPARTKAFLDFVTEHHKGLMPNVQATP